jgi:predicted nucleotidyltransferase
MGSIIQKLVKRKVRLISPPSFLPTNIHYEVIMGSRAYGCNQEDKTDYDIYGFVIPPKNYIFPHLDGVIPGFGYQGESFDQWQIAHIIDKSKRMEYDFQIYNIVKYFRLCYENNPNMIDSLFVPDNCVLHCTHVGHIVRDNRKLFLSKQVWQKFKGYAFSQLKKMENKEPIGKRAESVEQYGYDVKYAYHLWRLLDEAEQILSSGDLNLQRCREALKSIRRGEWTEERLRKEFEGRLPQIEDVHAKSKLPLKPDEQKIKSILLQCLEAHYGSLSKAVSQKDVTVTALRNIDKQLDSVRSIIYGGG